jgi:hypothetical protein
VKKNSISSAATLSTWEAWSVAAVSAHGQKVAHGAAADVGDEVERGGVPQRTTPDWGAGGINDGEGVSAAALERARAATDEMLC